MNDIVIPYKYKPRKYQFDFLRAMDSGYKRAAITWHRRCGKDKTMLNFTIKKMFERVGAYFYFFPTYRQAKKVIWEGRGADGFKLLDHFPKELVKRKNSSDMLVELINGSIFQLIGTDNLDGFVGTNAIGCVFSEYSLQDPRAWDFIRPILSENGGWAVFNFTPRGNNHAKRLFDMACKNDNWFSQLLTVDDTTRDDGSPVITQEAIEEERLSGMSEEMIQQEYYCSFEAAVMGAYYSKQLTRLRAENRYKPFDYEPNIPVYTVWDLGIDDAMAIGWYQGAGSEFRMVDYIEGHGKGLNHYINLVKGKPYKYGGHFAPHDIQVRELSDGESRYKKAMRMGITFRMIPNLSIIDGIESGRQFLDKLWINADKCERYIDCLTEYHQEYDEKNKCFKDRPCHNWASHGADVHRYAAIVRKHFTSIVKDYSGVNDLDTMF